MYTTISNNILNNNVLNVSTIKKKKKKTQNSLSVDAISAKSGYRDRRCYMIVYCTQSNGSMNLLQIH